MLLLGRHHLVRGGFANGTSHLGSGELVLRRGDAIRKSLSRHFLPVASTTTSRINFRGKNSRNAYDIRRQKRDAIQGGSLESDDVNSTFRFPTGADEFAYLKAQNIYSQFNPFYFVFPRRCLAWVGFSTLDNASIA